MKQSEEKIGNIIVPGTFRHKKKLTEAEVIKVGNGTPDIPMETWVGDTILFHDDDSKIRIGENVLLNMSDILLHDLYEVDGRNEK